MTTPKSSIEILNATQSQAKVLKLVVVSLFIVLVAGGIQAYRYFSTEPAELTTDQVTALAKTTPPEDRAAWLRLARAALASENVQQIAAPVEPRNNLGEASKVELGYQLFFDPILSADKTTSCASCHHPDFGMADGLIKGVGAGGKGYGAHRAGTGPELPRNTPSIFNVAFNEFQFWDGRVRTLEEQVLVPLFAENEMNQQNLAELLKRLRAVPQYREMFAKAFGFKSKQDGSEINLQNIARAIAAFERKLNITETNYDHFAKGKDDALTTEQLRGLVAFMGQGQCAVCHTPPHFHDGVLSSIGTTTSPDKNSPIDPDPGFGAVLRRQDGFGMFKTPGLRNVERTAPICTTARSRRWKKSWSFTTTVAGADAGRMLTVRIPKSPSWI